MTSGFYFGQRVKYQKRNPDRGLKVSYTTQINTCINVQRLKHIFTFFFYIDLNIWTCWAEIKHTTTLSDFWQMRSEETLLPIIERGHHIQRRLVCLLFDLGYNHFTGLLKVRSWLQSLLNHCTAHVFLWGNIREPTHTNRKEGVWKDLKDHFRKKVRYENFTVWRSPGEDNVTSKATSTKDSSFSWEQCNIEWSCWLPLSHASFQYLDRFGLFFCPNWIRGKLTQVCYLA